MATDQSLDTLNNNSIATVMGQPSWSAAQRQVNNAAHQDRGDRYSEVLYSDLLEHRKHVNLLATTYLGRVADNASSLDPIEAISVSKAFKGEADSSNASLAASTALAQILAKISQSTPPESGMSLGLAQLNAVTNQNSQNSNAIAAQSLAALNAMNHTNQSTNAAMLAIAGVLAKVFQTVPSR